VVLGGLAAGLLLLPLLPHCRRGHGWVDGSAGVGVVGRDNGRGGERDSGGGGLGGRGCASSSSRLVSAQWRMGGAGVLFINHD
jgi:hypothetical protein